MKTLKEVCKELNISRRVVQIYQAKGLIAEDGRNKYDHLLFKEETIDRIGFIRFCQKLDMSMEEISEVLALPTQQMLEKLKNKEEILRMEYAQRQELLNRTEAFLNKCSNQNITNEVIMETIRKEIL